MEIGAHGDDEKFLPDTVKEFRIEGSEDSVHWTRLFPSASSEHTNFTQDDPWSLGQRRVYPFANDKGFLFYRIVCVKKYSGGIVNVIGVFNLGNIAILC